MTTLTDDLEEILTVHTYGTGGLCLNALDGYRTGCGWKANIRRDKHSSFRAGRLDVQHRRHVAEVLADAVDQAIAGHAVWIEDELRRAHGKPATPPKRPIAEIEEALF